MKRKMETLLSANRHLKALTAPTLLAMSLSMSAYAVDLPTGEDITHGDADIFRDTDSLTVDQHSSNLVINWDDFSIASGNTVNFLQNRSDMVLNRVVGDNPSNIFGSINAGGHVFLINQSGILFAPGARVDAAGLVASTLDMADADFLSGNYLFEGAGGDVINQGELVAADGGYIALFGRQAINEGIISARLGSAALVSGDRIAMDFTGDGLIRLEVDRAVVDGLVSNHNLIYAEGGRVYMTASAAGDLAATVVNNDGIIEANSVEERDGKVFLVASGGSIASSGRIDVAGEGSVSGGEVTLDADGTTIVSGQIDARSGSEGGEGGSVNVLGDLVGLAAGADINASGVNGGGEVLVGGDFQGANAEVRNASRTFIAGDASITADALELGDGGRIIVWADEITRYYGHISATGGSNGGNGGFAEVSGKELLGFWGTVDLSAPLGNVGALLLDPDNLTIVSGLAGSGADDGELGDDQILFADGTPGDFTISNGQLNGATAAVTLEANNDITVSAGAAVNMTQSLSMSAGNNIILNDSVSTTGTLQLVADADLSGAGTVDFSGGGNLSGANVSILAGSALELGNVGAGANLTITTTDDTITQLGGTNLISGGLTTLNAGNGAITLDGATNNFANLTVGSGAAVLVADQNDIAITSATADSFNVRANGSIVVNGNITTTGDLILNSDRNGDEDGYIFVNGAALSSNGGNIVMGGGLDPNVGRAYGNLIRSTGIWINPTSSLNSAGGNISLRGGSDDVASGNQWAVYVQGAVNSGDGTILIDGLSRGTGTSNAQGVSIVNLGGSTLQSSNSTASAITVTGITQAGANTSTAMGVNIAGYDVLATNGGGITITGTGGTTSPGQFSQGVLLQVGAEVLADSGAITVTGIAPTADGRSVQLAGTSFIGANPGGAITASTSNISILGDKLAISAADRIQSSGTLLVAPTTLNGTIGVAGAAGTLQLPASYFTDNFVDGFSQISIGNANTGVIRVNALGAANINDALLFRTGSNLFFDGIVNIDEALTAYTGDSVVIDAASGITTTGAIDFRASNSIQINAAVTATGNNVTLEGDADLTAQGGVASDTIGPVQFGASGSVSGADVSISSADATLGGMETLQLGNVTATGSLTITTSQGGDITQGAGTSISAASGFTNIDANGGNVTLANATNNFAHLGLAGHVVLTDVADATLVDANGIGVSGSATNLTITGTTGGVGLGGTYTGNVIATAATGIGNNLALNVTGTTTLNASAADVVVNFDDAGNNLNVLTLSGPGTFGTVFVNDINGIVLGGGSAGSLGLTVGGDVTQGAGALVVSGATTVTSNANDVNVDLSTNANNFGTVTLVNGTGDFATVSLRDTNAIVLGGGNATDLNVRAAGLISQSGVLAVSGTTTLTADTNAITATLTEATNDFGTVALTTVNGGSFTAASITDTNALSVGGNAGSLTADAGGALEFTGGTYTNLTGTAGGDISQIGALTVTSSTVMNTDVAPIFVDLSDGANDFNNFSFGNTGTGIYSGVSISDDNAFTTGGVRVFGAGDISLVADDGLTILGMVSTATGSIFLNADDDAAGAGLLTIAPTSAVISAGDLTLTAADFDFDPASSIVVAGVFDLVFSQAGTLCLGDAAGGVGCQISLDNNDLSVLTPISAALELDNSGQAILADNANFNDPNGPTPINVTLLGSTIDNDVGVATVGIFGIDALTLNTTGAIGGADDLVFTANSVVVGNAGDVNLVAAGAGDTSYDIGLFSSVGNVSITEAQDKLQVLGIDATGTVTLNAQAGQVEVVNPFSVGGAVDITGSTGIVLGGGITTTEDNIDLNSAVTLNNDVSLSTGAGTGNITVTGTVNSDAGNSWALNLTAGTGTIDLQSAVGTTDALASLTVNSATAATFGGAVTTVGVQDVTATTINTNGTHATTNSDIALNGAVLLQAATALTTGGGAGDITVTGSINGGQTLDLTAGTGSIDLQSVVGDVNSLASLTVNSATAATFGGAVTTVGAQDVTATTINVAANHVTTGSNIDLNGDVVLSAATALNTGAGAGDITVTGTVNGAQTLDFAAGTGSIELQSAVGDTTPLTSLTVNSASTATFGADVTTTGVQSVTATTINTNGTHATTDSNITLSGVLALLADTAFNTGAGAGDVTVTGTIDGARALEITAGTGSVDLQSAVGSITPLSSLTVNSATAATFGGDVTTTGAQDVTATTINVAANHATTDSNIDLNGDVVLAAATALTTGAGAGNITVTGTINGAQTLGLTAGTGSIDLQSAVGNSTPLISLTVNSADTTTFGGNVTTLSNQSITSALIETIGTHLVTSGGNIVFTGNVDLLGTTTLDTTPAAGSITVTGTIDGAEDLIVDAAGNVNLQDDIGVATALTSLDVDAIGSITLGGDVTTVGSQTFTTTGAPTNTNGTHTTTNSDIRFESGLTLLADTTLNTGAAGGNVTVTGVTNGAFALDISAGTGTVQFQNSLSGLASLTINDASAVTFTIVANTTGVQDITADVINVGSTHATTNSDLLLTGDVVLSAGTNLSTGAGAGDIIITGTVNGAQALNMGAGTGNVELQSDVGDTTPLASLVIASGTTATLSGNVTTSGNQVYNADTTETNGIHTTTGANIQVINALVAQTDTTFDTGAALGGTVFFQSTADGPGAITVTAGTGDFDVTGDMGALTPLASLTVNSATNATFDGDVTTVGVQDVTATTINTNGTHTTTDSNIDLNGAVVLQASTALNTGAGIGDITVTGTISGTTANTETLTLTAGQGNIDLQSAAGTVVLPLGDVTINSAANVDVDAVNAASFTQLAGTGTTTLGGAVTTSIGDVQITTDRIVQNAVVSSAGDIVLNAAADIALDVGALTAGNRLIHLIAGAGVVQDTTSHGGLQATDLLLEGSGDFILVTSINDNLISNVASVGTVAGGVRFENDQALVVGSVADTAANNYTGISAQSVLLSTRLGDLTNNQAVTSTTGNLLLQSQAGNVAVNEAVTAATNLTIEAGIGITQSGAGSVSAGNDLAMLATNGGGFITMADGTTASATNRAYLFTFGDIRLGGVVGDVVTVRATGSVIDNGDTDVDITARTLRLEALGIGSVGEPEGTNNGAIDTDVDTLSVRGNGSVYVSDAGTVALGTVSSGSTQVNFDGSTSIVTSTVTSNAFAQQNFVVAAATDLTADNVVSATSGNILLSAGTGNLVVNNTVTATAGSVELSAGDSVVQASTGDVTAGGTIFVDAATGSITMADGAFSDATGNVVYSAATDITLGSIDGANLAITAGGDIIDGGDANVDLISVNGLILSAGGSIGAAAGVGNGAIETAVSAVAFTAGAAGSVYLEELNNLVIQTVPAVAYNQVSLAGVASSQPGTAGNLATAGENIKIQTGGTINVTLPVVATNGDVLLTSITGDVDLNQSVTAGGNVSVVANQSVFQKPAGTITAQTGTLDVQAVNSAIVMNDGAQGIATLGNVRYLANTNVALGGVSGADVLIQAGGDITDAGITHTDVTATNLQLVAGNNVGASGASIDVDADVLAVSAGGDVFVVDANSVSVGTVSAFTVNRVDMGMVVSVLPVAQLIGGIAASDLVIEAVTNLTVDNAVGATAGGILLHAQSGDLTLNSTVQALNGSNGNVSLAAGGNLTQTAGGDVTAGVDVEAFASAGAIFMADGAVTSAGVDLAYVAGIGDLTVGALSAVNAYVGANNGSIIDGGDTDTDIQASTLQLRALNNIGAPAGSGNGPIDLDVVTLATRATNGNLYLSEADDLVIGSVNPVNVNRVSPAGTVGVISVGTLLLGATADDFLKIETLAGGITVNEAVLAANSDLLLDAQAGDLAINNTVTATAGNASLLASANITQAAAGDVTVGGTLDMNAQGGDITMLDGAISTATSNIRYLATGDIRLASLIGTNVLVNAGGSITDNGETHVDVIATTAQLMAGTSIGEPAGTNNGPLETTIGTLAASAGTGNIYLSESDNLTIGSVVAIDVERVLINSTTATQAGALLEGAIAAQNLKVEAGNGIIVANAVEATAADLLLDAQGGDLAINATVDAGGNASLLASANITQAAAGDVTVGGTLDVNAQGGNITMADDGADGAMSTATGNIRYLATGDIRLASLNGANVLVESTGGSIIDNGETDVDLIGASVQLRAANSIGEPDGTNNGLLETTAGTFNARANTGGIYIDESDALVIDETAAVIDVLRVGIDDSTSNQSGSSVLFAVFAGNDVIVRANTDLTVANNGAPVSGVYASAGNLLLRAETGNLQIDDAVQAAAGDVTLQAPAGTLGQGVEGDVSAGGDVFAQANGTITMADGALTQATNNVFYGSAADLRIGSLVGANVLVDVTGSIIDNGDAGVDVVATTTQLRAGASIGEAEGTNNGQLEATVTTLAATAGSGDIYVTETDALVIGSVAAINVDSVGLDAVSTANVGSVLAGAVAAQNLMIEALAGGITVDSAVDATAANLLLDAQAGDLVINATVDAGGNASLLASANITQTVAGDVTVGGTLDAFAQGGDITMDDNGVDGAISTAVGNIRYEATGDIRLASLSGADVEVRAADSIIDNGETDVDVIATNAMLIAGSGVITESIGEPNGTNNGPVETTVDVIAAEALSGNVYLFETDDLEIGFVAPISVNRVGIDNSATILPASQLTGIRALFEIDVEADDILIANEVSSDLGNILLRARNGGIDQTGATLADAALNQIIALAGDITMLADNGDILLQRVSADGNTVTLTASGQILNDNLGPDLAGQVNVIADTLIASANNAIGVTAAGQFTDPTNEQRLITEVENDIQVFLAQAGTVAIDNTSTDGSVDVVFNLPLADASNGSSVWVRSTEALRALGLEFATESGAVEFDGNLQLLAVNGDLTLNEAQVGDANDVNLVAQWMRLEAARGAFRNGDGSRFQQVGDGLGLTADDLVLITGGDLGVSATVDRLNVIGTGLYQVAVGGTPGAGGENANLDMQLSRRDIALVDESIRFETIIIDRQLDPAPSWITDLDSFFQGLGATGWQENVFGLFTTGTARVISLRQDDGVNTTHDGSIRFVDNVDAGQLSLPADLTIEVRAGEFGADYAGTIYVDSGVTFVAQNVGTPVTGSASIFGNVLIDGSVEVQEDRSVELQGRGGDIIIDSDESAAGRVLLSPGLGFDVIFTNAATFTVTQGVGAEGDLVILSARNVVMDPDTAIIADGSVLIGADNITGDVVLAEGSSAVQGDVILYNVTANANDNGIGDVVVYTTGEAAGDTYLFDFGTGVQTYEISGRIVLGRQDVFDNLITELTNDPLFLDNLANIPPPAVQGVNVRLIAADSIESGWSVDYDFGLLPEQELVHVVATQTMELRAINGLVGGTVAPQGLEGLTAAEQPLRVVVGDLMRLGAGDYDRYATSVHLVGTAQRFEEIRRTPGLITFNTWQVGGNLEPKFVSGTGPDATAFLMAGYGELLRRPAQTSVALSHSTDNALQLISFVPGQPEPLTALWVVDDTPVSNEVLEKSEQKQEPFRSFEVRTGDSLWNLAEEFLGDAERWQEIWWLTPDIENPDLIEPGQKINLEREQLELLKQIQQEEEAKAAP